MVIIKKFYTYIKKQIGNKIILTCEFCKTVFKKGTNHEYIHKLKKLLLPDIKQNGNEVRLKTKWIWLKVVVGEEKE